MIRINPNTGEYVESTFTNEGQIFRPLTEQEVNAYLNKPKFTSVVEEPVEEDDASFLTDAGRVGFSILEGFAQLGSDVIIRPFVDDKKEYDESYSEWRGEMAEYVPGLDREDIIDEETGEVLRTETGAGMILDVASYLVGGGVVFKALGKISKLQKAKYGNLTRGVIAEQTVEQVLADPHSNLANLVSESLMDEPPEVIEFLAADEADDVLFNRAKMAMVSGVLTAGIGGILKLGFKTVDVAKHSRAVIGKESPSTPGEYEVVIGSLLQATKEQLKDNPSPLVEKVKEVAEDSAEGVSQIIKQSSGSIGSVAGFSGVLKWVKQRYFLSRGFLSKEGYKAQEDSIESQKRLVAHAGHLAKRLQRFMDDTIEGNIVDDVNRALTDKKMLELKPDEKIKYLVSEYKFSTEIAEDIADARGTIDTLSKTILDSNIGSEAVREAIDANMGSYMRKSYRLYEDADWSPSDSLKESAKDAIVKAKLGSKKAEDVDVDLLEKFTREAYTDIAKLLDKNSLLGADDYLTQIRKVNKYYLTGRKEMLPEIEKLMGIIESPTENIILTIQKSVSLTENNKFYTRLLELGGSVPSNPSVYDESLVKARIELASNKNRSVEDLTKGSYVTIDSSDLGVPTGSVGKVLSVNSKKTPGMITVQIGKGGKKINVKKSEGLDKLSIIPNSNKVNKLATQYYDDVTGGKAYTSSKYISKYRDTTGPLTTEIKGTGSVLDGQYTTKELARSIHGLEDTHLSLFGLGTKYFEKGAKNQGIFRWFAGAKGLNQQMRTVYDHTTHLRNGLGGLQFGLANGLNPLKNGRLNFQVLRNEIGEGSDKVFDEYYELLQGLGVIGTSVRGSEARALLDIASETTPSRWAAKLEDYAKRNPDTRRGKLAEMARLGKNRPEQIYMATDDFFKMNGFANELVTLRKAHAGDAAWTEDLLRIEAANLIKDTMPNYNRVTKGIKALREMPIGNFVAFPAEIARTSANILSQSMKEIKSGNSVLRNRGLQRLAGFSFTNLGWTAAGSFGYKSVGFSETENEGLQTNAESYTTHHDKQFIPGEDGVMYVHDPTYINSYYVWQDIGQSLYRELSVGEVSGVALGERMMKGVLSSAEAFVKPFTDESMFTQLMGDLYYASKDSDGRAPAGRKIFKDKEDFGGSIYDIAEYMAAGFSPGFILDGIKYSKAIFEEPNANTGLKDNLTARTLEMLSGINFRKYKPEDNFGFHIKKFNSVVRYQIGDITPKFNKEGAEYFKEYSTAQAKKFRASQELYRQIEAMRAINFKSHEIYAMLKKNGITSKKQLRFLMRGRFDPDTITPSMRKKIREKASDVSQAKQDNSILREFYSKLNGALLQPIDKEDIARAELASGKISRVEYDRLEFKKGGEVNIPRAPREPDERIDKMTGLPYNVQAGMAFIDDEDPLKRLGFAGGGQVDPLVRLGFSGGSAVGGLNKILGSLKRSRFVGGGATYTIQAGDTLSGIAKMHGISQEKLQELNKIEDPDKIFSGSELKLSSTETEEFIAQDPVYTEFTTTEFTPEDEANVAADILQSIIRDPNRDIEAELEEEKLQLQRLEMRKLNLNTRELEVVDEIAPSQPEKISETGDAEDVDYEGVWGGGRRRLHEVLNEIKNDLDEGQILSIEAQVREWGAYIDMMFAPVGELIGTVASALTPDAIEEPFKREMAEVGENIGEWIKENGYERSAKNVNALISIVGIIPAAQILKRGINTVAAGTKTKLDGFYEKSRDEKGKVIPFSNEAERKLSQLKAAGTAFAQAAPSAVVDVLLPGMIARRRLSAAGSKRKEIIREEKTKNVADAYSSAMAGRNIVEQSPDTKLGDLVERDSALSISYIYDNKKLDDYAGVRAALFKDYNDFDVPLEIQDAGMNHILNGPWTEGLRITVKGKELKSERPLNPQNTDVDIKRLDSPQNLLTESHGELDIAANSLRKIFKESNRAKMAKYINQLEGDGTFKKTIKLNNKGTVTPASLGKDHHTHVNVEATIGSATPDQIKAWLSYKGDSIGSVTVYQKDKFGKYKRDAKGAKIVKLDADNKPVLKLDKSGNPVKDMATHTGKQLAAVAFRVDENNPNIIYWSSSHKSNSKESGGVNDFVAFDLKTKEVYTMVSDKHDMLANLNPIGGTSRLTIAPITKRNFVNPKLKGKHTQRDFQGEAKAALAMLEKYKLELPEGGLTMKTYDPLTGVIPTGKKTVSLLGNSNITIDNLKKIASAKKIEKVGENWKIDGDKMLRSQLDGAVHINQTTLAHFAGKATSKDYATLARRLGKIYASSTVLGESNREGSVLGGLKKVSQS